MTRPTAACAWVETSGQGAKYGCRKKPPYWSWPRPEPARPPGWSPRRSSTTTARSLPPGCAPTSCAGPDRGGRRQGRCGCANQCANPALALPGSTRCAGPHCQGAPHCWVPACAPKHCSACSPKPAGTTSSGVTRAPHCCRPICSPLPPAINTSGRWSTGSTKTPTGHPSMSSKQSPRRSATASNVTRSRRQQGSSNPQSVKTPGTRQVSPGKRCKPSTRSGCRRSDACATSRSLTPSMLTSSSRTTARSGCSARCPTRRNPPGCAPR